MKADYRGVGEKEHQGVVQKGGGWILDQPGKQKGKQGSWRVVGVYPEGKDPDSSFSSSPSFTLQTASSSFSPEDPPFLPHRIYPAPVSVFCLKQSGTHSQFLFFLFQFSC